MRCVCTTALCLLLLASCASSPDSRADRFKQRINSQISQQARRLAPDLVLRAQQAWELGRRAQQQDQDDAADDHFRQAQLLLEAAIIEAQRIRVEREAQAVQEKLTRVKAQLQRDLTARRRLEVMAAQRRAAQTALAEADRVMTLAEQDERRPNTRDSREAAEILRQRARLLLAAAEAVAAPNGLQTKAAQRLEAAERDPLSLNKSEAAVDAAQTALSAAREEYFAATAGQLRALKSAAESRGFDVEQSERGFVIFLPELTARPRRNREWKEWLGDLEAIIEDFPQGPLLLEIAASDEDALQALVSAINQLAPKRVRRNSIKTGRSRLIFIGYRSQ